MRRLTITEKKETWPVAIRNGDVERDFRTMLKQLVRSMPKDVLVRTSHLEHINNWPALKESCRTESQRGKGVQFVMQQRSTSRAWSVHPETRFCPGSRLRIFIQTSNCPGSRVLSCSARKIQCQCNCGTIFFSGEPRNPKSNSKGHYAGSSSSRDDFKSEIWWNMSEMFLGSISIYYSNFFLTSRKKTALLGQINASRPRQDRYISGEEGTVVDHAAEELELIAVS